METKKDFLKTFLENVSNFFNFSIWKVKRWRKLEVSVKSMQDLEKMSVNYEQCFIQLSRSSSVTHIPLDEFLTQIKSTRDSTNFKGMIDAASATTSSPSSYFKTWKIKSIDFHIIVALELWRQNSNVCTHRNRSSIKSKCDWLTFKFFQNDIVLEDHIWNLDT